MLGNDPFCIFPEKINHVISLASFFQDKAAINHVKQTSNFEFSFFIILKIWVGSISVIFSISLAVVCYTQSMSLLYIANSLPVFLSNKVFEFIGWFLKLSLLYKKGRWRHVRNRSTESDTIDGKTYKIYILHYYVVLLDAPFTSENET